MGIFNRAKDVMQANLNSMLDRAEDPEKMIRLIVADMEESLVDLKAACAGAIAERKRLGRLQDRVEGRLAMWTERAAEAVARNREELAREALRERMRLTARLDDLRAEMDQAAGIVTGYRSDIARLEQRLDEVRIRERVLVQRHIRASNRRKAAEEIRRFDSSEALARFEACQVRLDRMEAAADLAQTETGPDLETRFRRMAEDEAIDDELQIIKDSLKRQGNGQDIRA